MNMIKIKENANFIKIIKLYFNNEWVSYWFFKFDKIYLVDDCFKILSFWNYNYNKNKNFMIKKYNNYYKFYKIKNNKIKIYKIDIVISLENTILLNKTCSYSYLSNIFEISQNFIFNIENKLLFLNKSNEMNTLNVNIDINNYTDILHYNYNYNNYLIVINNNIFKTKLIIYSLEENKIIFKKTLKLKRGIEVILEKIQKIYYFKNKICLIFYSYFSIINLDNFEINYIDFVNYYGNFNYLFEINNKKYFLNNLKDKTNLFVFYNNNYNIVEFNDIIKYIIYHNNKFLFLFNNMKYEMTKERLEEYIKQNFKFKSFSKKYNNIENQILNEKIIFSNNIYNYSEFKYQNIFLFYINNNYYLFWVMDKVILFKYNHFFKLISQEIFKINGINKIFMNNNVFILISINIIYLINISNLELKIININLNYNSWFSNNILLICFKNRIIEKFTLDNDLYLEQSIKITDGFYDLISFQGKFYYNLLDGNCIKEFLSNEIIFNFNYRIDEFFILKTNEFIIKSDYKIFINNNFSFKWDFLPKRIVPFYYNNNLLIYYTKNLSKWKFNTDYPVIKSLDKKINKIICVNNNIFLIKENEIQLLNFKYNDIYYAKIKKYMTNDIKLIKVIKGYKLLQNINKKEIVIIKNSKVYLMIKKYEIFKSISENTFNFIILKNNQLYWYNFIDYQENFKIINKNIEFRIKMVFINIKNIIIIFNEKILFYQFINNSHLLKDNNFSLNAEYFNYCDKLLVKDNNKLFLIDIKDCIRIKNNIGNLIKIEDNKIINNLFEFFILKKQ